MDWGERGRRIVVIPGALTARYQLLQAYGVAIGLGRPRPGRRAGWLFRTTTVLTLTGGVMALMWLGEWITARGLGNGVTLILFVMLRSRPGLRACIELGRQGVLPAGMILALLDRPLH